MKHLLAGICLALLAGCVTATETRYYTLDMRPSGGEHAPAALAIDRLRVSEPLKRKEILIQTTPIEIEYYARHEWAARIEELIAEKLAAEFGPRDAAGHALLLGGDVLAFGQVDRPGGADAHVKLALNFREDGVSRYAEPLFEKTYERLLPAESAGPAAVVAALSRALEEIAAEIARDAAAVAAGMRQDP